MNLYWEASGWTPSELNDTYVWNGEVGYGAKVYTAGGVPTAEFVPYLWAHSGTWQLGLCGGTVGSYKNPPAPIFYNSGNAPPETNNWILLSGTGTIGTFTKYNI